MRTAWLSHALALTLALASATLTRGQDATAGVAEWDPTRTVVFAVGVLTFESKQLETFPQEGRRDAELVTLLRERGARDAVFLTDREATLSRIERDFAALLGRTEPGQTLIVYYTGHGFREDDGQVGFAPWDMGDGLATTWRVQSIVDEIEGRFKGDRALLLVDCCHSGALVDAAVARADGSKIAWACLTSSHATSQSTGNWTFTEAVLDALRGDARVDANADGAVVLGEVAAFAEAEMAFAEEQLTAFHAGARFGAATRLAPVSGGRPGPRVGERLEVHAEGDWWKARVLEVDGERLKVRFYGWDASYDEWVRPDQTRPYRPPVRPVGQQVEVESEGEWWKATVIESRAGLQKVTYEGFDASWDEWVPASRIREPGKPREERRGRRNRR